MILKNHVPFLQYVSHRHLHDHSQVVLSMKRLVHEDGNLYSKVKKKKEEITIKKPKEKVVRNDVSLRKEENKNTDFTCIKSSWKSFCKNNLLADTIVEDILPKINTICFLSYKLINFHFTRLLEEHKPLPEIKQNGNR